MMRAGIALGAAWLLALGLGMTAALPARGDLAAANVRLGAGTPTLPTGVQPAPVSGGIPGNSQGRCPPRCVPSCEVAKCIGGSGSGASAAAADEGENRSLATVILLLLCAVGGAYGVVKLAQNARVKRG